ncbi:MAG: hypothetical protein QG551_21 [Patescibacteria group bacterium]|nr:hypothetical protein [Patescibacteria group bacterium]
MGLENNFGTEKERMLAESIKRMEEEIENESDEDKKRDLNTALEELRNK